MHGNIRYWIFRDDQPVLHDDRIIIVVMTSNEYQDYNIIVGFSYNCITKLKNSPLVKQGKL